MLIQFVKLRLMGKQHCLKTLESLLPLLLHPNTQIRIQVGTFITILANASPENVPAEYQREESKNASASSRKIVINRAPLFSQEEFYCFVRPKLLQYYQDQSDEMMDLLSATHLLNKLRKPLSLSTMRKYFKLLTSTANE